jgi:membrane protease YdiL (CAAX protease family)
MEQPTIKLDRELIVIAWIAMLIASALMVIIWREFTIGMPIWWPWLHVGLLGILFVLTWLRVKLRPLRGYILILIAIFMLGFGGGWSFGLVPLIRNSDAWVIWEAQNPWAITALVTHLIRLIPALFIISGLLLSNRKRSDFFLIKGDIHAMVEPSKLIGMKHAEPWPRIGGIFAIIFSIGTLIFLLVSNTYTLNTFIATLNLIPVSILIAIINGFNEEFTLRAAPLSELWQIIGKPQALLITTIYFGLGHFYGVPNGILGVCLSAFLGWFLGKSLLETKGFFWAWFIHVLPDIFIFIFYAMSTIA